MSIPTVDKISFKDMGSKQQASALKYGVEGLRLMERIREIAVLEKLESIKEAVKISKNMEEISNYST